MFVGYLQTINFINHFIRMKALSEQEALKVNSIGSLKGTITAGYDELIKILGEPTFEGGPETKINYEWAVNYKGDYFYIYDWKVAPEWAKAKNEYEWHVGGEHNASEFIFALHLRVQLLRANKGFEESSKGLRAPDVTEDERSIHKMHRTKALDRINSLEEQLERLLLV